MPAQYVWLEKGEMYSCAWNRPQRIVGGRGYHIFLTVGSQMTVRLSDLRAGHLYPLAGPIKF